MRTRERLHALDLRMVLLPARGPRRRRRDQTWRSCSLAPRQAEITPVEAAFAAIRPGRYSTAAGSSRDEHPASTLAAAVFEMPLGGCQPLQPARRAATIARDVDSRSAAISDAAAATLVAPAILPVSIVLLRRWADGRGNHLETRHKSNQSHMPCPAFTLSRPVKCRGHGCLRLARRDFHLPAGRTPGCGSGRWKSERDRGRRPSRRARGRQHGTADRNGRRRWRIGSRPSAGGSRGRGRGGLFERGPGRDATIGARRRGPKCALPNEW